MATTDLKLEEAGALPRPGPIGRLVRLAFGLLCMWYVYELVQVFDALLDDNDHVRSVIWNGVLVGLFLVSYVINIGFSRSWGKWPALVSAAILAAIAAGGYLATGSIETGALARSIWVWELYVFSHLGLAFVTAGIIGTPGCEMRAFHDLYTRVTGHPTREHHCPIGPLGPIDRWESHRS